MWYLSGSPNRTSLTIPNVGFMLTPAIKNRVDFDGVTWAADNGRFSAPESYTDTLFLHWLGERRGKGTCLFACAPDVLGDASATLEMAIPMLGPIKRAGYAAALVAQDGLEHLPVPWWEFDALFLGGSTRWKLSEDAVALVDEAKRRGKWVHMGRVNSWRRVRYAASIGCDSVDGTLLKFAPNVLLPRLREWMENLGRGHQLAFQRNPHEAA